MNGWRELSRHLACGLRLLGELIFPRHCAVCHNETDTGCFCPACRKYFTLGTKIRGEGALTEVTLLYKYQEQLAAQLQHVKFRRQKSLLPLLAEEAALAWPREARSFPSAFDYVAGIPTSAERRQRRGFDIPEEIFAPLAGRFWHGSLLARTRRTAPLFGLPPDMRRSEISNCFAVRANVRGKSILLCDDIYTTGSTMLEAARTLQAAGAARVAGLAFTASRDNW